MVDEVREPLVDIFDEGDLSDDGKSPLICSNFRSISQNKKQRVFDDSAKNKNRDTETGGKEGQTEKTKTIAIN